MGEPLINSLRTYFGFDSFLPGQEEVIGHLLAGRSAAAVFPTGGGKSVCYQLPAMLLDGVTLVISPLIALMKDQIDSLSRRGIAAARLDSTLTLDEYAETMQQARSGKLRLLYVAPERFQNERFRQAIEQLHVALFAVDEAHCISEWGHNFRPDYLKLVEFARRCRAERLLALTATATPQVLEEVRRAFEIEPQCAIRNSAYRPNLTLLTTPVDSANHESLLLARLRERPVGPTIIYVTLQRTAEELAAKLSSSGLTARAYHAGLENEERAAVQNWFMASTSGIVVATIAFGMGIDKADIRYVYHFNPPKSLENYAQEIGRAGRDGRPGVCEVLLCPDDLNQLENFVYGDTPTRAAVDRLVEEVFGQGEEFDLSFYELSNLCDIRPLVVRTLLTYLELDGYLAGGTPYYAVYRFQPLRPSAQILAEFAGERREFLQRLLSRAKKGRTWFQIDLAESAAALQVERERIVRALDYLGERGWLKVDAAGTRHRYRVLRMPQSKEALAESLDARCRERERREIARLDQVLQLVSEEGCQVNALCRHFGETRAASCGHCTRCLGEGAPASLPKRAVPPLDESLLREAEEVRRNHPRVLTDARITARWLCGISSPLLSKSKLSSHALFGALGRQPFTQVLQSLAKSFP